MRPRNNYKNYGRHRLINKKYLWIWVTTALTVYLTLMAVFNRPDENSPNFAAASRQYWITIAIEVVIIIAVGFFLKKRYELAKSREELTKQWEEMQNSHKGKEEKDTRE